MKFTLSWLKEHLETDASPSTIAETLTRIGLEIESVHNGAEALAPFVIARVLTAAPHPQADKLRLLSVDAGTGEPIQVVCGAPNAREGLVGVFGGPGAYVPGTGITLGAATIRGVESRGMMCSSRELQLGDDHAGIIELPADAPVGTPYAAWAGLDDPVFDIAVTPNRGDALGVHGIARDLAAAGLGTLKADTSEHEAMSFGPPPQVRTEDPEGCPAFYAQTVRGVRNGPSPDWLQRHLLSVGLRPISLLVDITNYITIGWGRPLHVYDLAKISGPLVARKARAGETLEALNGKTYALNDTMTVIADDVAVHDIGGIMGGMNSGVSDSTTDVLIECAYFDPETIARTGQALGLTSDARARFERGVDPAFLQDGLALASGMILGLAGGSASEPCRAGAPPAVRATIAYDPARVESLAGMTVDADEQRRVLTRLGFDVDANWHVRPPSWRRDVEGLADVVEEIVRIVGIDRVPSVPLPRAPGVAMPTATPMQRLERRVRRMAAARGMHEAVTWSFISSAEADAFGGGAWTLANPISAEMKVMRPSLLPGLVAAARRNRARGETSVRLFEVGRRYEGERERLTLGLVLAGDRSPRGWRSGRAAQFDAFDAKAEALALLEAAGAPANAQTTAGVPGWFHPARGGQISLGRNVLAAFGELHPATARALDIDGPVVAAEIFLDAVPLPRSASRRRAPFAPHLQQAVSRDFAFLVAADVEAETLVRAVRGADKARIADVRLFDRFTGAEVAEGMQSLAVEVTLQPEGKSFTEADISEISARIVAAAAKVGGQLRS
jgi:phenylalanyl-tRNA synthetase beta chain